VRGFPRHLHVGESLSYCCLNKHSLINSLGAEVHETVGLSDGAHAVLPYKISPLLLESHYLQVPTAQKRSTER
jgi:hypothetical protein